MACKIILLFTIKYNKYLFFVYQNLLFIYLFIHSFILEFKYKHLLITETNSGFCVEMQ